MNRSLLFCAAFAICGCAAESPALQRTDGTRTTVTANGHRFNVYTGAPFDCVEAHRVNFVFPPPPLRDVVRASRKAVLTATGCDIDPARFHGDHAIQSGVLVCDETRQNTYPQACPTHSWKQKNLPSVFLGVFLY